MNIDGSVSAGAIVVTLGMSLWNFLLARKTNEQLEKQKTITAAEMLKQENFINSKREAYFTVIGVLTKYFAGSTMNGIQPSEQVPTESEINAAVAKLRLFSSDPAVIRKFIEISKSDSPHGRPFGEFLNLIRKDMGYPGELDPATDVYIRSRPAAK